MPLSVVDRPITLTDKIATIGRYKQVIGDGLRSRKDGRRTTKVGIAVFVLNRMRALGRPISVRIA
jgi:hypothetical protein